MSVCHHHCPHAAPDDVWPSQNLLVFKEGLMSSGYAKCDEFIQSCRNGKLATQAGMSAEQSLEVIINGELSRV